MLDSGAPWYDTYECRDGGHVAIGAFEGRFYAELVRVLQIDPKTLPKQHDRRNWPALPAAFAACFRTWTRGVGRASSRKRVCPFGLISVVPVECKIKEREVVQQTQR